MWLARSLSLKHFQSSSIVLMALQSHAPSPSAIATRSHRGTHNQLLLLCFQLGLLVPQITQRRVELTLCIRQVWSELRVVWLRRVLHAIRCNRRLQGVM